MRKMIVIAAREYQAAVKTKTFIITVLAMPILMGGGFAAQVLLKDRVDTTDKRVAVLDHTGRLFKGLAEAARVRNEADIFEGKAGNRRQVRPRFIVEQAKVHADGPDAQILELSDRVRSKDDPIFGFVVIDADAIGPDRASTSSKIRYYSNSPVFDDLRRWVSVELNRQIQQIRLQAAHLDPAVVEQAMKPVPVANLGLVSVDETGKISQAKETNELATIMIPAGMMMLMFMVVMIGAAPLTQSILEEKMQRIAEVLLGSVPPFQLMMGKLIGMVGVSLTLATLYLVGAAYAFHSAGYGAMFPSHLVWWFVIFQSLAVLLYGSLFIAIGAAVSDIKESQNLHMPMMIVVVAPLFVWFNILREPTATFSVVASLVPTATPMLMLLRQAVPPGVPLWQPLLGIGLVLLTTVVCVFVAGRIFRVGILMQGKAANLAQMLQWVIRG